MPEKTLSKRALYMRGWRARNPDRWSKIARKARDKWRANNYERDAQINTLLRYAVRREILDLLGGQKCVHCGYANDWRALQIDHIHGGGKHDQRTSGGNNNLWAFRNWLKKNPNGWQNIYQVLCANCNWIKRHELGEHPGGVVKKDA